MSTKEKSDKILKLLFATTLNSMEIAERVNCAPEYVRLVARKNGYSFRHRETVPAPSKASCLCPPDLCSGLATCRMKRQARPVIQNIDPEF
jgi:hypothetical protein